MRLVDPLGRSITYLRLSVTDRCNLRCRYCMPPGGIDLQPREALLTLEELLHLSGIFTRLGIRKIRITGGEPFCRKGVLDFLMDIRALPGLDTLHLTSNGVGIAPLVPTLRTIGVDGVNLSLDTLDRDTFKAITGRDALDEVMETFHALLDHGIPVKINTVVLGEWNTGELGRLAALARHYPVEVRFIEEMPLIGQIRSSTIPWDRDRILARLTSQLGELQPLPAVGGTARRFTIPGHAGTVGIIAGHSRSFCAACDRIRINARGFMKTCLYGPAALDLRKMLREHRNEEAIARAVIEQIADRSADGFEAHARCGFRSSDCMPSIGG
jgi:cyclic pyranopterin phosphate synthase